MNSHIREAAAEWLVEFRTDKPTVAARRQFAVWLRTSPEHIRAYLDGLALWEEASCYDKAHRLDIDGLVALARTDRVVADIREISPLQSAANPLAPEPREPHATVSPNLIRRRLLTSRTGIAALLSLAINCGLWWLAIDSRNSEYITQIGEQRSVVLSDGSHVALDALSNVRVKFTRHERSVVLLSGQALFRVIKDARYPFVVSVGDARIRAVGTEFNVNRTPLGTVVTVLEGRVLVFTSSAHKTHLLDLFSTDETDLESSGTASNSRTGGVLVNAGQQTTITRGTVAVPQEVDTAAAIGWTRNILISEPLAEAAEELDRSNLGRLVTTSRELDNFHVT